MSATRRGRRILMWILLAFAVDVCLVAVIPATRTRLLQTLGALLITRDPLDTVDVVAVTESGEAGELELIDLYHDHVMERVLVLTPAPTPVDRELFRRGVRREDLMVKTLLQLGMPRAAIMTVEAGEGGTNESVDALAAWAAAHPVRVLVVVSPTHARRYRRTLLRAWPRTAPLPRVRYPRASTFHAEDWWTSRRTRRDGLFELEKLAWDYLSHPF